MSSLNYEGFKKEVNTLNLEGIFDVGDYYEEDVDDYYSIYSFEDFNNQLLIQYYTDPQEWTYEIKGKDAVGCGKTLEAAIVDFNTEKTRPILVSFSKGCTIRSLIDELEKYSDKELAGSLSVRVSNKGIDFNYAENV